MANLDSNDLGSRDFSDVLSRALRGYEQLHAGHLTFLGVTPLTETPQKPYTAKAIGAAMYRRRNAGDIHIVVFSPNDGTGDAQTYSLDSLVIPSDLRFAEKPERVIPRSKEGIACEGFFPLFSIKENGTVAMFSTALDILTVDDIANPKSIVRGGRLGLNDAEYAQALSRRLAGPRVYQTVGTDAQGNRFGDPHAIYNCTATVQVAGFLALGEGSPLLPLARGWDVPRAYR